MAGIGRFKVVKKKVVFHFQGKKNHWSVNYKAKYFPSIDNDFLRTRGTKVGSGESYTFEIEFTGAGIVVSRSGNVHDWLLACLHNWFLSQHDDGSRWGLITVAFISIEVFFVTFVLRGTVVICLIVKCYLLSVKVWSYVNVHPHVFRF